MIMEVDFLSFEKAEELAKKYGTPLLVVSRGKVTENYSLLRDSLPKVDLFYAVKANPHKEVVKTVNKAGGNFDISSIGEFELVRKLKVPPERLIYTQPVKKPDDIAYLYRNGIDLFVFDNEEELRKIRRAAPGAGVLLRIATSNPYCVVNLNYKFGADPREAEALIERAVQLGLRIAGIAFHVGSQSSNPYAYVETILTCKRIYDLSALKGIKMDILDIGGGFPVRYVENVMPIRRFCEPINDAVNNYFAGTRVMAEPGRVICGDAVVLITSVVGKSNRNNVQWYYIDDGLYNSFSGKVYDHAEYEVVSNRKDDFSRCVLAGPTCDSFDVISSDILLPRLEIGDLLLVPSMGAYTNVSATEFNMLSKAKIISID
jgi:ornithine decarboxylase